MGLGPLMKKFASSQENYDLCHKENFIDAMTAGNLLKVVNGESIGTYVS